MALPLTDLNAASWPQSHYQKCWVYSDRNSKRFPSRITHGITARLLGSGYGTAGGNESSFKSRSRPTQDAACLGKGNNVLVVPAPRACRAFHGALRGITERKQAEEACKKSEERVRLILDSAAEGVFVAILRDLSFLQSSSSSLARLRTNPSNCSQNMHALEHHTRKTAPHSYRRLSQFM